MRKASGARARRALHAELLARAHAKAAAEAQGAKASIDVGNVTIKEAARLLDVAPSTLRYWEEIGLIESYRRAGSNYRTYSLHDLFEASSIAFFRKMGVPVKTIAKMRSNSLDQIIETLEGTSEHLAQQIERLTAIRDQVEVQRVLAQHAHELIDGGVREACPTALRLLTYNPELVWQRETLLRDSQRYAVLVRADAPDVTVEACMDFVGSETPACYIAPSAAADAADAAASEGAEGTDATAGAAGAAAGAADAEASRTEGEAAKGAQADASAEVSSSGQGAAKSKAGAGNGEGAAKKKAAGSVPAEEQVSVLWDREDATAHNIVFFEGVAFAEKGERVHLDMTPLFESAREAGHVPLYAIGHFLVTADFNGRKDCYRVWVACEG